AAVRHFSRAGLSQRLEKRGRGPQVARLMQFKHEVLLGTSFIRMAAILSLVFLVARWFGMRPVESALVEYLAIFVTSLMLIMVFGVAIPNAWARYGAEPFLAAALPVLLALRMVLYPLLAFLDLFDVVVKRLLGV